MFRFYNQFIASCDPTDVIDLYVSCFLYVPLTDFHSIYFIIVNSDAPIIARATQNGDPRAICRLPQKVASLEPPISNMDTHIYTHLYDIQRSFSYMYNCRSTARPASIEPDVHLPPRLGKRTRSRQRTFSNDDWNNKQMMTLVDS